VGVAGVAEKVIEVERMKLDPKLELDKDVINLDEEVEGDFEDDADDVEDSLDDVDDVGRVADDFEVVVVSVDDDDADVKEVLEDAEVVLDPLVEILLNVIEVVALDDVDFVDEELVLDEVNEVVIEEELVVDEVEPEELLLPPPDKIAHVLPKFAVLLNASTIILGEFELPLVTLNLVVDAWPEARV
jgi:hypothetical protein